MEGLDKTEQCDELFSLTTFCELHSLMISPKESETVSYEELTTKRKEHAKELEVIYTQIFGTDFDTYEMMIKEVLLYHHCNTYFFEGYREFKEQLSLDSSEPLDSKLNKLFSIIPKPTNKHEQSIIEYVSSISHCLPEFEAIDTKRHIHCNELHVSNELSFGFIPEKLESNFINMSRQHDESMSEEGHQPISYITSPIILIHVLKEQFIVNAILTSISWIASSYGIERTS